MGHPVLRRPATEVADPTAPDIRRLIADMYETMQDANGAGIAAPQVYVPLRVVMFRVPAARAAAEGAAESEVPLTVLINPSVEALTDAREEGWEGCLSVPGMRGLVPRWTRVRYVGLSPGGERIERYAQGFHARVVQHECDHLDGILYPQRMTDLGKLLFESEWKHWIERAEAAADEDELA